MSRVAGKKLGGVTSFERRLCKWYHVVDVRHRPGEYGVGT